MERQLMIRLLGTSKGPFEVHCQFYRLISMVAVYISVALFGCPSTCFSFVSLYFSEGRFQ